MRILLATPDYHTGILESVGKWVNCGFVYMAGELKKDGHEVIIYDAMSKGHRLATIRRNIARMKPAVVATTAYTSSMPAAARLLEEAKKSLPQAVTVIGGVHPSFCYEEVLESHPWIDVVVVGEGEVTMRELMAVLAKKGSEVALSPEGREEHLAGVAGLAFRGREGIVFTGPRPFIENLDEVEGAWDLVEWKDYTYYVFPRSTLAVISTSRGCKHDCRFCSQQKFWHQSWRARSPEKVLAEIEMLHRRFGVNVIMFADEYPTCDRQRWEAILDGLIERRLDVQFLMETRVDDIVRDADIMNKYREAGIVHIYVGVEATDQVKLDRFKKGILENDSKKALDLINEHGIVSETSFVLGVPEETEESIRATLELAKEYNPDFGHFLLLTPWPYADMYDELKPFIEVKDYSLYNLVTPIIKPHAMTRERLLDLVLDCYREFYFYKMGQWKKMQDPFKKEYLLRSMKIVMRNSFLTQYLSRLGNIPPKLREIGGR